MSEREQPRRIEAEPYSDTPYIGFQTRVLLGGEALNPDTIIDQIEDLTGKNIEYSPVNSVSNKERLTYWQERQQREGQMTFDQQKTTWKKEMKATFDRKKAFFENDQNKKWVELYGQFEINAKDFDEHQAEKLYDKFFNGTTNGSHDSKVDHFVGLVADFYKNKGQNGSYDYDGLMRDMDAVKWIAGIFGHQHATEIIANLTDLAGKKEAGKLQELANRAEEKVPNTTDMRVNTLTAKEMRLLEVIRDSGEEIVTEEKEEKEASAGEEAQKKKDYHEIPADEPFSFIKNRLQESSENEEAFKVSFDKLEKILNTPDLPPLPENITISDITVRGDKYNIVRVNGKFTKEESGSFSFEIGTRNENELYVPGYNLSTETGGKGGGGDVYGIENKLSQYINTSIGEGWEVSGYKISDSNLVIHFKKSEDVSDESAKAGGPPAPEGSSGRLDETVEEDLSHDQSEEKIYEQSVQNLDELSQQYHRTLGTIQDRFKAGEISEQEKNRQMEEADETYKAQSFDHVGQTLDKIRETSRKRMKEELDRIINRSDRSRQSSEQAEAGSLVRQFEQDNPHISLNPNLHEYVREKYKPFEDQEREIRGFSAKDETVSIIDVPDKNQDSVGIAKRSDGKINIAVADGVSGAIYSKAAARIAVREVLSRLETRSPHKGTIEAVGTALRDPIIKELAEDYINNIRKKGLEEGRWNLSMLADDYQDKLSKDSRTASSTMVVAAQYDKKEGSFTYALRGDSQIAVFRSDGNVQIIEGQMNDQLYYSDTPYVIDSSLTKTDQLQLNNGDVILVQSDGLERIPGIHNKINEFLRSHRNKDRADQELANFLREEIKAHNPEDDVTTVIVYHEDGTGDNKPSLLDDLKDSALSFSHDIQRIVTLGRLPRK